MNKTIFEEDIMKKLFAVLLAVVMVVGLCACSVSEKPAETTAAATTAAARRSC